MNLGFALLCLSIPASAQSAAALADRGAKLLLANRAAEAQSVFAQSLRLNPAEFEALSGMGFLSFSQGSFAEARRYLEKAVAVRPQSFQGRFLLGASLVQLKQPKLAIVQLRQAVTRNPAHLDARKLLASQFVETAQFREAIAVLQPPPPLDEEMHLLLIESLQSAGDSARAFATAAKAAERFPNSAPVLAWLGFQLQFAGRYEEAKQPLRRAIEIDPESPVPLQVLGEVFLKQEDYAGAKEWLSRAARQMPGDTETLLGLSRAHAESGELAEALAALLQAAPDDARVHLQLSRLYFRQGDQDKARREAELSIKLREKQPAAARRRYPATPPPPSNPE